MEAPPTVRLGERLRKAREEQGVTLRQVAADTRIMQRYLELLEAGDYAALPGDVVARGFVRNYAEHLKLPAEELVAQFRKERGTTEPLRVQSVTSAPRIPNLVIPNFLGVLFVVLMISGLGYLALSTTNRVGESASVAAVATPQINLALPEQPTAPANSTAVALALAPTPQPTVGSVPDNAAAGGVVSTPTALVEPTATAVNGAPIVGEVRVGKSGGRGSWVNIVVDGRSVYQGIIKDDSSQPFTARRKVELRIGNAGPVSVVINGQEFSGLGGNGDPITWSWPR